MNITISDLLREIGELYVKIRMLEQDNLKLKEQLDHVNVKSKKSSKKKVSEDKKDK